MRDRPPVHATWPERLTQTPFAVTLSMSLGEFIEVLEQSRQASPEQRFAPRDPSGAPMRTAESAEREASSFTASPVHFPVELTEPGPVDLPPIEQEGRGRPSGLSNARAQRIIEMACTGASIPVCAAAAGVTPNTLKSWLRRKDHEAFLAFQRYFAEAVTYATLATLKAIMEGVAADPKHAFEFRPPPSGPLGDQGRQLETRVLNFPSGSGETCSLRYDRIRAPALDRGRP